MDGTSSVKRTALTMYVDKISRNVCRDARGEGERGKISLPHTPTVARHRSNNQAPVSPLIRSFTAVSKAKHRNWLRDAGM